ncbi:hypothetical protein Hamer_G001877 [Homarus americanus]|uniref:Uncharacterized protein n=1 Tax=Homarus americanus TaxID=6706 RepID=A0A8J5JLL2_HOMAM|nr:hypothetical protein Hamer_G001877 [Homarus americanus]
MPFAVLVSVVVGTAVAAPDPRFRFAYSIPTHEELVPQAGIAPQPGFAPQLWRQFMDRIGPVYTYGYELPGRVHYESKDGQGVVKGTFGYTDPYKSPAVWKYVSDTKSGFQVESDSPQQVPQVRGQRSRYHGGGVKGQGSTGEGSRVKVPRSEESAGQSVVHHVPHSQPQVVVPPQQQVRSPGVVVGSPEQDVALLPLLKQAAEAGQVLPAGFSPSGTPQFVVTPELAEEAGGVSALAYRLGAVPVAAVHDVQVRPSHFRNNQADFSPVLVHQERPEAIFYTLEVPIQ